LAPGEYFLIQEAAGAGGSIPLPTPDATGTIAMSATAGKVALRSVTTALTCSTDCGLVGGIVDFVGYGSTASSFEGAAPTSNLSNTLAALRLNGGAQDTDDNSADFVIGAPNPHNSVGVPEVPLPAALPLFITGLGALGLFGWRRKKKVAALAG
jgi:hypothetical protein